MSTFGAGDMQRVVGFEPDAPEFFPSLNHSIIEWNKFSRSFQYLLDAIFALSIRDSIHFVVHDSTHVLIRFIEKNQRTMILWPVS